MGAVNSPSPDAELRAMDRTIALLGALGYVTSQFPGAHLEWGDPDTLPEPDDIDGIWCQPEDGSGGRDRWIAASAVSGTYGPAERSFPWGGRVLAGTRDYLRFAIGRLRDHGQHRLADALESEILVGKPAG
jgi:hypothetical protein